MNIPQVSRFIFLSKNALKFHRELSSRLLSCSSLNNANKLAQGPDLKHFISQNIIPSHVPPDELIPYLDPDSIKGYNRKVFLDVYGCQMNVNDTEIVWSILQSNGFSRTQDANEADVILMMTCAIRENAENKIWHKLKHYRHLKQRARSFKSPKEIKIGVLGCMAERLKEKLVERERSVDIVAGPDSYRDLPRLLALTDPHQPAINVLLSQDETYADITPVRLNQDSVTAYVSIMRGCDNMCTYCIVPWTRGRERSRPLESIVREVEELSQLGVKEVTLLGQNVNSYRDMSGGKGDGESAMLAPGFKTVYKPKAGGRRFADLLDAVASVDPQMRIRFTSPHPKDFPQMVLNVMASHPNICKSIHMPAQSGSTAVLERMRRGYTPSAYLQLVDNVRTSLPGVTLSSDFICGFCGETEQDFQQTLDLMSAVRYNVAYLFAYSMREKTTAHRRYADDVLPEVKQERLLRMFTLFREIAAEVNKEFVNSTQTILIEGRSKRSESHLQGRTDGNIKVIIPEGDVPTFEGSTKKAPISIGDYLEVKITDSSSQVLKGIPKYKTTLTS